MAATISANSAGGGGLVSSGDASGVLALQTAGVTALSISAAQKVTFANSLTSPTLVTPVLGTPSSGVLSSCTGVNMCKAWVKFNGVTTVTIQASFNIATVTRSSAGVYVVTFTTPMADANYVCVGTAGTQGSNGAFSIMPASNNVTIVPPTASAITFTVSVGGVGPLDSPNIFLTFFGN